MGTSQRVSRGFHRLGLFFAAIPLVLGVLWAFIDASQRVARHRQVLCAHEYIQQHGEPHGTLFDEYNGLVSLKPIGCSEFDSASVGLAEVRDPHDFNWAETFTTAAPVLAPTLY